MRRIKGLFLLVMMITACFLPVSRIQAETNYRVIINDQEDLLTDQEENMLRIRMDQMTAYGNAAFVTVRQFEDVGTYAKRVYREYFGTDSGMLFLIDMGRRKIWIFSDGAVYRVINKAYANTITDNVYRYASREEYYACADHVFEQALTLLEGGRIAQPMKYISNILIALVSALLINFLFLTSERKKEKPDVKEAVKAMSTAIGVKILSEKMLSQRKRKHYESSSSGGSSGGGYSGGGSSGGGFSGGGGGSSGGGGGHSF
ncbi:MAG: TPM domain-containing protein [Solobacterium sp.]|nr:TPM domain-containing protein [Solobacterium sp.]